MRRRSTVSTAMATTMTNTSTFPNNSNNHAIQAITTSIANQSPVRNKLNMSRLLDAANAGALRDLELWHRDFTALKAENAQLKYIIVEQAREGILTVNDRKLQALKQLKSSQKLEQVQQPGTGGSRWSCPPEISSQDKLKRSVSKGGQTVITDTSTGNVLGVQPLSPTLPTIPPAFSPTTSSSTSPKLLHVVTGPLANQHIEQYQTQFQETAVDQPYTKEGKCVKGKKKVRFLTPPRKPNTPHTNHRKQTATRTKKNTNRPNSSSGNNSTGNSNSNNNTTSNMSTNTDVKLPPIT